jgi:hypothetical protein
MIRRLRLAAVALVAAGALALAGCSKATEVFNDAPINSKNDLPADVYSMPDGFSNVASKCDGKGHRIFVAYHGDSAYAAIAVIDDATCAK